MEDDAPRGVPEWVVTYGDMMSLLLTFFIMLVSLSEVVADKKYRAILAALQQYVGYRAGPIAPPGKNFPLNSLISSLESLGSFTNDERGFGGVKKQAVEGEDLRVYRTREGTSTRVGEPVYFAPTSTELSEQAQRQLEAIAVELAGKPNKLEIRAHTSPTAHGSYADKLALTYGRARSVLAFLVEQDITEERIRITAAADTEPLRRTGDDQSLMFDRAEIFILDTFTDLYRGPREIPD